MCMYMWTRGCHLISSLNHHFSEDRFSLIMELAWLDLPAGGDRPAALGPRVLPCLAFYLCAEDPNQSPAHFSLY